MSKEELKPCPFCGGIALLSVHEEDVGCMVVQIITNYTIGCLTKDCWCELTVEDAYHDNKKDCIKDWNRRCDARV